MTVVAIVTIGGVRQSDGTLGAFINGEVRGVSTLMEVPFGPYMDSFSFDAFVYGESSDAGATITYAFAPGSGASTVQLSETSVFESNGAVGSAVSPLSLTGRCRDWCDGHTQPWSIKCVEFDACTGCGAC